MWEARALKAMIISSALLVEADGEADSGLESPTLRSVATAAQEVRIDPIVADAMGEVDSVVDPVVL